MGGDLLAPHPRRRSFVAGWVRPITYYCMCLTQHVDGRGYQVLESPDMEIEIDFRPSVRLSAVNFAAGCWF